MKLCERLYREWKAFLTKQTDMWSLRWLPRNVAWRNPALIAYAGGDTPEIAWEELTEKLRSQAAAIEEKHERCMRTAKDTQLLVFVNGRWMSNSLGLETCSGCERRCGLLVGHFIPVSDPGSSYDGGGRPSLPLQNRQRAA